MTKKESRTKPKIIFKSTVTETLKLTSLMYLLLTYKPR